MFLNAIRNYMLRLARFLRISKKLEIGFILVLIMIAISLLEPTINNFRLGGHRPEELGEFEKSLPSSYAHPLGTDHYGRDMFGLQLVGLRNSLLIGSISGGTATLIAVCMAVAAGYLGGKWDAVLNSMTNAVLVIPSLPILMVATVYVRVDLVFMAMLLAIFSWPWAARTIRAQILSLKERPFIDLAKVSGSNNIEIMFKEIIPNLAPYIIVAFSYALIGAILAETGLRMIGLGPTYLISLGVLINWAVTYGWLVQGYYHIVLSPILLLVLIFVSLNLINMGLESVFNPRLKKITGA